MQLSQKRGRESDRAGMFIISPIYKTAGHFSVWRSVNEKYVAELVLLSVRAKSRRDHMGKSSWGSRKNAKMKERKEGESRQISRCAHCSARNGNQAGGKQASSTQCLLKPNWRHTPLSACKQTDRLRRSVVSRSAAQLCGIKQSALSLSRHNQHQQTWRRLSLRTVTKCIKGITFTV